MGLAEKRVVKAFQEGAYKELEAKIFEVVGKDIEMEIDWNSLALEGMSHLYEKSFPMVYFSPLIQALESICADDMGKEAVNEELDKIVIKNEAGITSANKWALFENKTLTLDHKPTTNVNQIPDRSKAIQTTLENNL